MVRIELSDHPKPQDSLSEMLKLMPRPLSMMHKSTLDLAQPTSSASSPSTSYLEIYPSSL